MIVESRERLLKAINGFSRKLSELEEYREVESISILLRDIERGLLEEI